MEGDKDFLREPGHLTGLRGDKNFTGWRYLRISKDGGCFLRIPHQTRLEGITDDGRSDSVR